METIKTAITVAKGWFEANRDLVDKYAVFSSGYLGMVDEQGGLQLYDGRIRLIDKTGKKLEEFDPQNYLDVYCRARGRLVLSEIPLLPQDGLS